ncbi:Phytochrome two-component sensor histidine kinase Cyanobacterial phytochrome B [Paramagnetospirillum magnetotacticum MS-1]|uniref:histidine kinase n=1 Tax=Paramagnetospirillum magnetotacticum MS-1 TaxID=272627 RepID=A0A0C2YUK9_PARME|nr:ATP-binding protein [Paramagnetospirillum magnetotacticum]KIL98390.1 Phytochrome two-component sensor histidine kinase Cyanobacterial phytochrome B [Paramagnetospirillum magnetotacticum MS-1]
MPQISRDIHEAAQPGDEFPRGTWWRRAGVVFATAALIGVYVAVIVSNLRDMEQERTAFAESQASKILLSFETHTVRLLDLADIYLRSARHFVLEDGPQHLGLFLDQVTPPKSDLYSTTLTVLDRRGRVTFSTDASLTPGSDHSDMPVFLHFQGTTSDSIHISAVNDSTLPDQQFFHIARPLLVGKELTGVIVVDIHSSKIAAFYRDMTLGQNSSAAIFSLDRKLIARQPPPVAEAAPMGTLQIWNDSEGNLEGRFRKRSLLDGIERTFLYKRLANYPLVVVVGFAHSDISAGLDEMKRSELIETIVVTLAAMAFATLILVMDGRNRRLAEAERTSRAAAQLLERSNADLERFAYVASHDLKTPLRVITGYAQMLDRRYRDKLDEEANEYIAFLTAGTKRMYRLITDLLHYSRINSQAKPLQPVSSGRAADIAISNLKAVIEENGATISVGPLPTIQADESQLSSLFQNLLGNAIKYRHPERKPLIRIEAVRLSGTLWRFAVKDNGIGIEPEHFERIFVIFQRLHADSAYDGTGIGLALCQRIVTRLGGRIWVESKPGEGSTFFFTANDATRD